jgi:riboflavin kinase/FMN adenylyltransferase
VYTFDPHPRVVLDPGAPLVRLMTRTQLERGLAELGVDLLVREPFTRELAAFSPEAFIETILAGRLGPSILFVGRDFRFGRGRSGSDALLEQLGSRFGFEVRLIGQVLAGGSDVSSTRVRDLIAQGSVEQASALLGRPYAVWGRVVQGDRRGRALGFPTANLEPENDLLPGHGVYATAVQIFKGDELGDRLASVSNVGERPTFAGQGVHLETHLLDYDGDLYGERMAVHFCARVREERRFSGPDDLRAQIRRDCAAARTLLESPSPRVG